MEKKKHDWTECKSACELGDLERPSITEWLRHLARIQEKVPLLMAAAEPE